MPTVQGIPAFALWSGPVLEPLLGQTEITSALIEAVSSPAEAVSVKSALIEAVVSLDEAVSIRSALTEAVVAPATVTSIRSMLIETVVADNIPATRITSALIEVVKATAIVSPTIGVRSMLIEVVGSRIPAPRVAEMATIPTIDVQRFGEDILLPDPGREVTETISGDWPTLSGRPNLNAAVRRRQYTTPGQVPHRPAYGSGLETFIGELATDTTRARMAAACRQNTLRDDRLDEVKVRTSVPELDLVVVELSIKPIGEEETETISIVTGA